MTIKALSIRDSAELVGQNSQTAPTLGRRPSPVAASRGPPTLTTVTVCTPAIRTASTTRSAPLSVSAKRDMSMINQQIRARRAAVVINILVPAPVIPAEAARLAVENTRSVLAPADMLGTENLVLPKMLV